MNQSRVIPQQRTTDDLGLYLCLWVTSMDDVYYS